VTWTAALGSLWSAHSVSGALNSPGACLVATSPRRRGETAPRRPHAALLKRVEAYLQAELERLLTAGASVQFPT